MMNARWLHLRRAGLLLVFVWMLASCHSVKFYTQAVRGHFEVMVKAKPIAQVRDAADCPPKLRRQLALVDEIRAYAREELKLPTERQYRNYADLGRPFVVWNVYAAPEFSLEGKAWRYPFVGELKYRGFYSLEGARAEAADLKEEGFDVMVGSVRVYSTLGWFSDPVLNTFINESEAELAETLFHELTHARFFVSGDTDFNEAYATAAAQIGVRQWLRSRGSGAALTRYEHTLQQDERVLALLKGTRQRLTNLYAQKGTMSPDAMRLAKARQMHATREQYTALKRLPGWKGNHDGWVNKNLNNARLSSLATYHDLVPAFTRLFQDQGGDWERFHKAVAAMKSLSKEERRARLQATPLPSLPSAP